MSAFEALDEHEVDPLYWLDRNRMQLPPLRFDRGQDDALLEGNKDLHHVLTEKEIPHTFEVSPGSHDWPYWREHLRDNLLFFERILADEDKAGEI